MLAARDLWTMSPVTSFNVENVFLHFFVGYLQCNLFLQKKVKYFVSFKRHSFCLKIFVFLALKAFSHYLCRKLSPLSHFKDRITNCLLYEFLICAFLMLVFLFCFGSRLGYYLAALASFVGTT